MVVRKPNYYKDTNPELTGCYYNNGTNLGLIPILTGVCEVRFLYKPRRVVDFENQVITE